MRIPGHDGCFVCGKDSEIGLDFQPYDGRVCSRFRPSEKFQSFEGIIHGGVLASVLAEAMGMAVALKVPKFLGRKVEVEYHAPVRPGKTYEVCGEVLQVDGRKIFAVAHLHDDGGNLCATARGLFIAV
ncbi:MAG: PaaI family thioesterase [Thermotogae bacterium]|nr:PaaI family thioesterase [Thermotogota bacterium]